MHGIVEDTFATFEMQIDGLVLERRNSSALAMELHLSCIDPSKYGHLASSWK